MARNRVFYTGNTPSNVLFGHQESCIKLKNPQNNQKKKKKKEKACIYFLFWHSKLLTADIGCAMT